MTEPLTMAGIRADVAELLYQDPEDLADTDDLLASGLDSVRILSLVERWRAAGVQISFIELAESPTLGAWWTLMSAQLRESDGG